MIVACIGFACMWGLIRVASADLHPFAIVFWRNLFGTVALLPLLAAKPEILATKRLSTHVRRAGSGVVATFATFYAVANAPLATALAINYAAPLFATLAAALFLGERIRARRILALVVGFAGVMIVLRPGQLPFTLGIGAAVVSAISTAFSLIAIKQLVGTDDPRTVAAYSFLLMLPVSALVALPFWTWPSGWTWLQLFLIGAIAVVAQTATSRAFRIADATAVMPYDFVRFGLVMMIGIAVFNEPLDALTLVGGAVILGSTIYLAYREAAAARRIKPASQLPTPDA